MAYVTTACKILKAGAGSPPYKIQTIFRTLIVASFPEEVQIDQCPSSSSLIVYLPVIPKTVIWLVGTLAVVSISTREKGELQRSLACFGGLFS